MIDEVIQQNLDLVEKNLENCITPYTIRYAIIEFTLETTGGRLKKEYVLINFQNYRLTFWGYELVNAEVLAVKGDHILEFKNGKWAWSHRVVSVSGTINQNEKLYHEFTVDKIDNRILDTNDENIAKLIFEVYDG